MAETPGGDLIYYLAQLSEMGVHVVSNGAQTPHVVGAMVVRRLPLVKAVRSAPKVKRPDGDWVDLSSFEPDQLTTPRITGAIDIRPNATESSMGLAIVQRAVGSYAIRYRSWELPRLDDLKDGVGYAIRTYEGVGGSTEAYSGEPYALPLVGDPESTADMLVETMHAEHAVAVAVRYIDRRTGEIRVAIRNDLQNLAA